MGWIRAEHLICLGRFTNHWSIHGFTSIMMITTIGKINWSWNYFILNSPTDGVSPWVFDICRLEFLQDTKLVTRLNIYRRLLIGSTRICYDVQNYLWTNQKLLIYEVNFKVMTSFWNISRCISLRTKSFNIDNNAISYVQIISFWQGVKWQI